MSQRECGILEAVVRRGILRTYLSIAPERRRAIHRGILQDAMVSAASRALFDLAFTALGTCLREAGAKPRFGFLTGLTGE